MSSNPNASPDTLSTSQQQLLASTQQLQEAQQNLMDRYSATNDPVERKKIANEMDKNEALRANLLSSTGAAALVQNQRVANKREAATELAILSGVMEQSLKDARERLDEVQSSRLGKERMIELNTYYGKRFMAQSGVMKIFIYMCIPVLILAVLANMGLLPYYISGFAIVVSIVIGLIYIYYAVDDINRRDKMNFDEYKWEFDPSRVGSVINPDDGGSKHKKKAAAAAADLVGCFNGECCDQTSTIWDPKSKTCVVQGAQGDGSAVKGSSTTPTAAATAATTAASATPSLLGDLNSP
jgi:ABC-type multidrug transport system fused ATPase/permease subunit